MTVFDTRRAEFARLRPHIEAMMVSACMWLYDTVQPDGALQQPHGVEVMRTDTRRVDVIPRGYDGCPVIVVTVTEPRYADTSAVAWECENPLDGHTERIAWELVVDEVGQQWDTSVMAYWNWQNRDTGVKLITGSFALHRPASPSLLATVDRYGRGCQDHPEVPGEPSSMLGVFCRCPWYQQGNSLIVPPVRTELTHPIPDQKEAT